jgi:hypothetical protein
MHIKLSDDELVYEGDRVLSGVLEIGDFKENFYASVSYWDKSKYSKQWKTACERLLDGNLKSALVTNIYNPSTANFLFWWVLYLSGNNVYIQNHILFLNELDKPFDEGKLYDFVPDRETETEDGESVSEWKIDIHEVSALLEQKSMGSD